MTTNGRIRAADLAQSAARYWRSATATSIPSHGPVKGRCSMRKERLVKAKAGGVRKGLEHPTERQGRSPNPARR